MPVLISQSMVVSDVSTGTGWSWSEDELSRSGSSCCARVMATTSTDEVELNGAPRASTSTWDRASAAVLEDPLRKRISDVNWLMKSR